MPHQRVYELENHGRIHLMVGGRSQCYLVLVLCDVSSEEDVTLEAGEAGFGAHKDVAERRAESTGQKAERREQRIQRKVQRAESR
jgi:hypothetical protein